MIDPECRARLADEQLTFEIRFEDRRMRGRPKGGRRRGSSARFRVHWKADTTKMSEGLQPHPHFWGCLRAGLMETNNPALFREIFKTSLPFTVKIVQIDGRRGRRPNPELGERDRVLADFVEHRMSLDHGYDSAILGTLDQIWATAKEECWRGTIGKKTIKDAYDRRKSENRK
ncbi:hypothetical protein [Reyranella sp.]|uniref:hypothetical protein n=1 Tax=Reyranella sp. TaxID=1929291 RepID=UPI003D107D1D